MRVLRLLALGLLVSSAFILAPEALATATVNKQFTPATVDPGDISRFRISFFNSSLVPLTAAAVTDNLPAQMAIAPVPNINDTCGFGTVLANSGTQRISLSAGTIPAGTGTVDGTCFFEVDVVSTTPGNWPNTIPANGPTNGFTPGGATAGFQATEGVVVITNTTAATATLSVRSLSNPTGSKTFAPSPGLVGEPITLTVVLTNPNAGSSIPLTTFTDPLPTGMVVAATPATTIACTGTGAVNGSVTAVAGAASVSLTGGTIGDGGTCTMTVKVVVASVTGTTQAFANVVPANAIGNIRGLASATFNRSETVNSPIGVAKSFVATVAAGSAIAAPIVAGQEVFVRLDITNASTTNTLSITSFTDTLPAGMVVGLAAPVIDCVTNGGGTNGTISAVPGASSFTVNNAVVGITGATRRCRISVPVVASAAGSYLNNIPANAVTNPGNLGSPAASATLTVNSQLTVTKTVNPATAAPGQPVTFTITINNYSTGSVSGVTFTDTLPSPGGQQMVVSTPNGFATSAGCSGGTFVNTSGSSSLSWSAGTIVGGVGINPGVCTITFKANAPATATVGTVFTNIIAAGGVTGTGGSGGVTNPEATSVNVTMVAAASLSKAFLPTSVVQGGTSVLTVTLSNQTNVALTNSAVTDTLPAGITVSATPGTSTTCASGVVTATALGNTASIAGATIPANGSCNFKVNVIGSTVGTLTNSIPALALTNDQAASNPAAANANLVVTSGLTATKSFTPASVANGGVSQVTVRVTNPSVTALTNLSITDGPMTNLKVANPASASTTCAGSPAITAVPGSTTVSMSGANLAAGSNCDLLFNVVTSGNPANWPNSIPIGAITTAEGAKNTAAVAATLGKVSGISIGINKSFNPVSVTGSQPSVLQIDLTNPVGSPSTVNNLSFTDNLPLGMEVHAVPNISTTCTNGTVTAVPGSTSVSLSGATLPAASTCSVFVSVTSVRFLNLTNTIPVGAVTTTQGLTNSVGTTATLSTLQGLGVMKSFSPTSAAVGQPVLLDIRLLSTLNPTAIPPVTLHNVSFTDTLPVGLTVANPPGASTNCANGLVSTAAGSTTVTVSGADIAPNFDCHVFVNVVASSLGAFTNTIPAQGVVSDEGYSNPNPTSATLNVVNPPTLSKSFSPNPVLPGQASVLTITINNPNAISLSGVALTDTLPAGLVNSTSPNGATTCTGGAVAAPASGTTVALTNALVGANSACTVTVNVLSNTPNSYINTIPAGALATTQGVSNVAPASATLTVLGPPGVSKGFNPTTVVVNAPSQLTLTLSNGNTSAATLSATFTDTLPGGLVIATPPNLAGTCTLGSVTATANTTSISYASGASLPAGGCTIVVDVRSASPGSYINTVATGALSTSVGVNPSPATATLTVNPPPQADVAVTKTDGVTSVITGSALAYTVVVTNNGPDAADGTIVTDPAATGLAKTGVTCVAAGGAACPGVVTVAALEGAGLVMGALPNGGSATFTVNANVTGAPGTNVTNTATATVPAGTVDPVPSNNTASDTDAVLSATDLALVKTDSGGFVRGQSATFTLTVTNVGGTASSGLVTVVDTLPAGLTATAIAGSGWTCDLPSLTCTRSDSLAPATPYPPIVVTVTVSLTAASSVTNSATVSGGGDTSPPNNTGSDTVTVTGAPDLAIAKSHSGAFVTGVGGSTYTLNVSNVGTIPTAGLVTVTDVLPSGLVATAISGTGWSCDLPSLTCTRSDALATGNAYPSITLVVTVTAGAGATLVNTASVSALGDNNPANDTATDSVTILAGPDLAMAKTVSNATPNVGSNVTFTLTVTNNGPSSAANVQVSDPLPAGYAFVSATPSVGAYNPGTGLWSGIGTLANGGVATMTITATVNASGPYVNTATVTTTSPDPIPGNNTASVGTLPVAVASLAVTKTDNSLTYTPGGTGTYVVVVTNGGPSAAAAVTVSDTLPTGVTLNGTVTCVTAGTASCGSVSGTAPQGSFGATGASIAAGAGNSLTFTVPVAYASNLTTDPLTNTATATDPASPSASGSDSSSRSPRVALVVAKTDGSSSYTPGGTATYVVTVTNTGPSDAASVTVTDALPAGLTLTANVSCVANGTATCGTVTGANGATAFGTTGATLGAGSGDSLVFTVPVAFAAGMTANPLVNTATATDLATNATASGSDSDTLAPQVTLAVVKTDGSNTYTPGGTGTYTVTIANNGVSNANNVTVADALPAGVSLTATVTCVANGASNCGAVTGTATQTSFGATGAVIVPGAGNSLVFTVPVAFAAGMGTDPLVNTATAADGPSGATGAGSDSDARAALVTLAVAKTDNAATYTPGTTGTYVVTVRNTGTSDALNVTVNDALPAGVTLTGTVTCVANGIATCGTVSGTTGGTNFGATGAGLGTGAGDTLVFTVPVAFAANLLDDPLVNTATATDLASSATASGSDSDSRSPRFGLAIAKTDNSSTYTPGGTGTYTVVVTNAGPTSAIAVTVSDPLPAGVTLTGNVTCVEAGAATCGTVTGTMGQTSFGATGATIAAGAGNSLTLTAPVAYAAAMTANPLVNTATAAEGTTPPVSASDSDTLSAQVSLAITKTDRSGTYVSGGTAIYTITVANTGITDALNVTVSDPLPAGVTLNGTVTCAATGNAICGTVTGTAGQTSAGTTGARINAGPGNSLVFSLPVAFAASLTTDPLVNTATVIDVASGASGTASDSNQHSTSGATLAKNISPATIVPGGTATLTILLGNPNASPLTLTAAFTDPMPAGVTTTSGNSGTCAGATVTATQITLAAGATVPSGGCTIVVTITSSTPGTVTNVTGALQTSGGTAPPASAPLTVTATSGPIPPTLAKSIAPAIIAPGGTATLTITLGNANAIPLTLTAAFIDTMPAGVTTTSGNTGTCTGVSVTPNQITMAAGATLPPGGCTIVVALTSSTPGTVINTTGSLQTGGGAAPPGSAPITVTPPGTVIADLSITKTNNVTSVVPGSLVTYTIVVTNKGPSAVTGATVTDNVPAALTGVTWTCVASAGSSCPAAGSGNINTTVNLLAGATATFTLKGTLSASATGTLVNTATVAPPPGVTDPVSGNNTSTDSDPIAATTVDLAIFKVHIGTFTPGQTGAQYQITVTNVGSVPSSGMVTVTDVVPAGLTATAISGAGWTCAQPAGPCTRSDPLAPGASYPVLTLTVNVAVNPPSPLVNVASVAGGGDINGANNSAKDVINFAQVVPGVEPIPVDSPVALLLLAALLALAGAGQMRYARRR